MRVVADAIAHRDALPPAPVGGKLPTTNAVFPFWQYLGPNKFHTSMDPNGFNDTQSGRVNAVAFDPQHNGTWYAGAPYGGVWKSTDFGASWKPLTDSWKYLSVSSIAVDPRNANTLYVGTGDMPGGSRYARGVMKSTDGGASWTNVGLFGITIPKLVVDPDDSNNVLAVTSFGNIYRSTNAGASWTSVLNVGTDWTDLTFSQPNFFFPRSFYAVGNGPGGNIYRSDDHGASWINLSPPLRSLQQTGMAIATSFINPSTVYLFAPNDKKLLASADFGANWGHHWQSRRR